MDFGATFGATVSIARARQAQRRESAAGTPERPKRRRPLSPRDKRPLVHDPAAVFCPAAERSAVVGTGGSAAERSKARRGRGTARHGRHGVARRGTAWRAAARCGVTALYGARARANRPRSDPRAGCVANVLIEHHVGWRLRGAHARARALRKAASREWPHAAAPQVSPRSAPALNILCGRGRWR